MNLEINQDVFVVANSVLVDETIYDLWLNGNNAQEACHMLIKRGALTEMDGADEACVLSEVNDHYRLFILLEKYIENPRRMKEQCHLQLAADTCDLLIERYYDVDDNVIREILGKKLSAKTRKELEDVSEKTKVSLKSCRRQFDNFRRVLKSVEEMKNSLVHNVMHHFLLSEKLAKKYAAAIFITSNRFETGKKRLNYLCFDDFAFCANIMMQHWSYSSVECKEDDMDVEVDKEFLQNLKDFKTLLDKEVVEELKISTLKRLESQMSDRIRMDIELNFKNLYKILVNIAVDLNHTRDLRDFFVDLVEKVIEPCKSSKWSKDELEKLLNVLNDVVKYHDAIRSFRRSLSAHVRTGGRHQPPMALSWDRYMRVVAGCILRMYHS